jgi:hypothetical protein
MEARSLACLAGALLAISGAVAKDTLETSTDSKKIAWMHKGIDAVKSRLKDPSSAQFRGVYFSRGADNMPMTCGEVNSKNCFGGYTGHQRFISAGQPDLTFLENEVSGFADVWARFCR